MDKKISFKDGLNIVKKIQAIKEKDCSNCHGLHIDHGEHCVFSPESNYTKSCTLNPEPLVRTSVSLPESIPDCKCHCHHEFDVDCDCFGTTDQDKCIHCEPMKIDETWEDRFDEFYREDGFSSDGEEVKAFIRKEFVSLLGEIIEPNENEDVPCPDDPFHDDPECGCLCGVDEQTRNKFRSEIRNRAKERGINLSEVTK